jgi:transcriptional regulator with XRE-family HTH domain
MRSKTPQHIGPNIRRIRKEKGFTITFIANKLSKSPQWLSNIEKSRRGISPDELYEIARILNEDINIFFEKTLNEAFKYTGTDS